MVDNFIEAINYGFMIIISFIGIAISISTYENGIEDPMWISLVFVSVSLFIFSLINFIISSIKLVRE